MDSVGNKNCISYVIDKCVVCESIHDAFDFLGRYDCLGKYNFSKLIKFVRGSFPTDSVGNKKCDLSFLHYRHICNT